MTTRDRFGQIRPHPLLPAERDARGAFLAGMRALNIEKRARRLSSRPVGEIDELERLLTDPNRPY